MLLFTDGTDPDLLVGTQVAVYVWCQTSAEGLASHTPPQGAFKGSYQIPLKACNGVWHSMPDSMLYIGEGILQRENQSHGNKMNRPDVDISHSHTMTPLLQDHLHKLLLIVAALELFDGVQAIMSGRRRNSVFSFQKHCRLARTEA
jgi:hypothetical protein